MPAVAKQGMIYRALTNHRAEERTTMTGSANDNGSNGGSHLHRSLGVRDIVILTVAAIIGLQWLSSAAQMGPPSLLLWVLAVLIFFFPLAVTVIELSSRLPGEGGIYLWCRTAFGEAHGFLVGWVYWVNNVLFFPTLLLLIAGAVLFIFGERGTWLQDSAIYNAVFSLTLIWLVIGANIIGVKRGELIAAVGVCGSVGALLTLFVTGAWQFSLNGSATEFSLPSLLPDSLDFSTLTFFATMTFGFAGMEVASSMGGEIKDPARSLPRGLAIAGIVIAAIYILGTGLLMVSVPADQISIITGIPQAFRAIGASLDISWLGSLGAILFSMSVFGGLGAWVAGVARIPFVIGIDRYLPPALGSIHPRYGTPHVALLTQGVLVSIVVLLGSMGNTVQEAYVLLLDLSIILYLIPYLYLFVALPVLRMRAADNDEGVQRVPFGVIGPWLFGGLGFLATLLSVVLAFIPPAGTASPGLFVAKIIGGTLMFISIGFVFYWRNRDHG
jgi:amino acid transporter